MHWAGWITLSGRWVSQRYGLTYVDFRNQKRTVKNSGLWYVKAAASNRLTHKNKRSEDPGAELCTTLDLHRQAPIVDLNQSSFFACGLEGYNADETFSRAISPWNRSSEVCRRMFMRAKLSESKNIFSPEVCIYATQVWSGMPLGFQPLTGDPPCSR